MSRISLIPFGPRPRSRSPCARSRVWPRCALESGPGRRPLTMTQATHRNPSAVVFLAAHGTEPGEPDLVG